MSLTLSALVNNLDGNGGSTLLSLRVMVVGFKFMMPKARSQTT